VNTLALIDIIQEAADALVGRMKVGVVMKCHFLLLNGAHEALGISILRRLTDGGHADLDTADL
jgi:hypothetical protein